MLKTVHIFVETVVHFFQDFFLLQNSEDRHLFEIKMYALTVTFDHLNWPQKSNNI